MTSLPDHHRDPALSNGTPSCRELRHAMGCDELALFYQPVVDLGSGMLVGFEALVRWPHRRFGLLGPDAFVPMAEACGLSRALDGWVIGRACRQLARWQEDVLIAPGFRIAVNVSGAQLAGDHLPNLVADIIDASGADPGGLAVELTESASISDLREARRGADGLRELGVELALDDFGAAYSTFARLNALPFDVLKLDRSLVQACDDPIGSAVARAAIQLGHHLGTRLTAEGIETPQRAARMHELGCHHGQGHLWSRAVPAAIAERLLVTGSWPADDPIVMGVSPASWTTGDDSLGSAEHELGHRAQRVR